MDKNIIIVLLLFTACENAPTPPGLQCNYEFYNASINFYRASAEVYKNLWLDSLDKAASYKDSCNYYYGQMNALSKK